MHYPLEERPGARPAKTAPCYDRMKALGAVFGQKYGWERPNWFAPSKSKQKDKYSFRRTNFFEPVREECRAVRERVGLLDLTGFSKFEISGKGAEDFLDRIVANRLPKKVGRIALAHALTPQGGVRSEFTISRLRRGPLLCRQRRRGGAPRLRPALAQPARRQQRAHRQRDQAKGVLVRRRAEVARPA